MANELGALFLELGLDATTYHKNLAEAKKAILDFERIVEPKLKQTQQKSRLTFRVNDQRLTDLNRHLDRKEQHVDRLQKKFDNQPLTIRPKFDSTQYQKDLTRFRQTLTNQSFTPSLTPGGQIDTRSIEQTFDRLGDKISKSLSKSVNGGSIVNSLLSPIKAIASVPGGLIGSAFQGISFSIGNELSKNLGKGLTNALEDAVSGSVGSTELLGEGLGRMISTGLQKGLEIGSDEFQKFIDEKIEKINDPRLKQLSKIYLKGNYSPQLKEAQEFFEGFLGGRSTINEVGLFTRGQKTKEVESRKPVIQEQSAREWRNAALSKDYVKAQLELRNQDLIETRKTLEEGLKRSQNIISSFEQFSADPKLSLKIDEEMREMYLLAQQSIGELTDELEKLDEVQAEFIQTAKQELDQADDRLKSAHKTFKGFTRELPNAYREILEGLGVDIESAPMLRVADQTLAKAKAKGQYDPLRNQIQVTSELNKKLQGSKDELTEEDLKVIYEEIFHALDLGMGSFKGLVAIKNKTVLQDRKIQATDKEVAELARELYFYDDSIKGVERNAKVQTRRKVSEELQGRSQTNRQNQVNSIAIARRMIERQEENLADRLGKFQDLSEASGIDVSDYVEKFGKTFDLLLSQANSIYDEVVNSSEDLPTEDIQAKVKKITQYYETVETMSKKLDKKIKEVMEAVTKPTQLLDASKAQEIDLQVKELATIEPENQSHFEKRSLKDHAYEIGQKTGTLAQGTIDAGKDAINTVKEIAASPEAQALGRVTVQAGKATFQLAKWAYKTAEGLENFVFDLVPATRAIKSVTKNVVAPGVAYTALTHYAPGGQAIAGGLEHIAQMALNPAMGSLHGALGSGSAELVSHTPMLLQGTVNALTSSVTSAVETGLQTTLTHAIPAVLGGKALLKTATSPVEAIGQLATRPKKSNASEMAHKAGETLGSAVSAGIDTIQELIGQSKNIERYFREKHQELQQKLKNKDLTNIDELIEEIEGLRTGALRSIDNVVNAVKESGERAFGSVGLTYTGGAKGRISQRSKTLEKDLKKLQKLREDQIPGDSIEVSSVPLNIPAKPVNIPLNIPNPQLEMLEAMGDDLTVQALNFEALENATRKATESLENLVAKAYGVEKTGSLRQTTTQAIRTDKAKDQIKELLTNTGGFVASKALESQGIIPELSGDLLGALVTRQIVEFGDVVANVSKKLNEDAEFIESDTLGKLKKLINELNNQIKSDLFASVQNDALFGDITGFAIGNTVAKGSQMLAGTVPGMDILAQVPLRGALAAMPSVAKLKQIRESIVNQINNESDDASGNDLLLQSLDTDELRKQSKNQSDSQKAYYRELIKLIDDAIDKADQFDRAFDKQERQTRQSLEDMGIDPDQNPLVSLIEKRIEAFEAILEKVEGITQERFKNIERMQAGDDLAGEIPQLSNNVGNIYGDLTASLEQGQQPTFFKALKDDLGDLLSPLKGVLKGFTDLRGMAIRMVGSLVGLVALQTIVPMLGQLYQGTIQAALGFAQFERSIDFASRTSSEAQRRMSEIDNRAQRLGLSMQASRGDAVQFLGATRGTSLEGRSSDRILETMDMAGSALQLDPQRKSWAMTALGQMSGKGVIQMEELRGQLSESLPSALKVASDALGMTTGELNAFVATGQLTADEFLPKFEQQLRAEMGLAAEEASKSTQASMMRVENSFLRLNETIGKGTLPLEKFKSDILNMGLEGLILIVDNGLKVFGGFSLFLASKFIPTMFNAVKSMWALAGGSTLLANAIKGIPQAIASSLPYLGKFAAFAIKFAAFQLIFETISGLFKDMSRGIKEFADTAEKSTNRYIERLRELRDIQGDVADNSQKPTSFIGDNTFIGSIANAIGGENGLRSLEEGENLLRRGLPIPEQFRGITQAIGSINPMLGVMLNGTGALTHREAKDSAQAIQTQRLTQSGMDVLMNTRSVRDRELNQVLGIESELRDLSTRRRALLPGDVDQRSAISARERELRAQLERPGDAVAETRAALSASIQTYQEAIEKGKAEGATIESLRPLENMLEKLKDAQEDFNARSMRSIGIVQRLSVGYAQIAGSLRRSTQEIQIQANQQRSQLNNQVISGQMTTEQAAFITPGIEQESIRRQIEANSRAIQETLNNLSSDQYSEILNLSGLNANTSSEEIRAMIEASGMQEGEQRSLLEQFAQEREKIDSLNVENSSLMAQLSDSRAQATEQITNLNKEIRDYFLTISRSAQDIAMTTRQTDFTVTLNNQRAKMLQALGGYTDKFFGELIGNITSAFEKLFEIPQNMLNLDQQLLGFRQQLEDQQRQYAEMNRSVPQGSLVYTPGDTNGMQAGTPGRGTGSGFHSPLQGVSIQRLVDYQESQAQSFRAHRNRQGRRGYHSGIDFDRRVGGGEGANVVAMEGGEATITRLATVEGGSRRGEGSMQIRIRFVDEQGRPIEYQYNHLSEAGVMQALGRTSGRVQVRAGQLIGTVAGDDTASQGAHLDVKLKVGGQWVDPQQYLAARGGQGGNVETLSGSRIRINAASRSPGVPQNAPRIAYNAPASGSGMPSTWDRYLNRLAFLESTFNANATTRGSSARGAFQFTRATVQDARSRGIADPTQGSIVDQARATMQFIQQFHPEAARAIANADFGTADRLLRGRWVSLPGGSQANQSQARYQQAAGMLRGQGLRFSVTGSTQASSNVSPGVSTNQSQVFVPPQIDTTQLEQGNKLAQTNYDTQARSARELANSQNNLASAEASNLFDAAMEAAIEATRRQQEINRNTERQLSDLRVEGLEDTPFRRFSQSLTELDRRNEDQSRELQQTVQDSERSLTRLRSSRQLFADNLTTLQTMFGNNPEYADELEKARQALAAVDQQITQTEANNQNLQRSLNELPELFAQRRQRLQDEFRREQEQISYDTQSRLADSQVGIMQGTLEQLNQLQGDSPLTRELQRNIQIFESNRDLSDQLRQIDEMVRSGQLLADTASKIKQNMEMLNEIRIDNISDQFDVLKGEVLPGVKNAFQGFFSGLLQGTESFGDLFRGLISNIGSMLADLAAQFLMNEIFGSLFGGGGSPLGGGSSKGFGSIFGSIASGMGGGGGSPTGSIVSSIIGGIIGGFADGGLVGFHNQGLESRKDAIGEALRNERMLSGGKQPYLAVLHHGERVLTPEENKRYESLQRSSIFNFASGGTVGSNTSYNVGNNVTVNVPINMNGDPEGNGGLDVKRIQEATRKAILEEMQRQKRPGGQLYS